jgi:small subunit ribosomal protein S21
MNNNKSNKVTLLGNKVIVGDMPINTALRKFKQKVDDSGILETLREKMFYEKPTSVRKRKKGAARARWLKKLRDQELPKKMY